MVSTRRGTANAELATASMERPDPIQQAGDTIHVLIADTKKVGKASLKRKMRSTPPNTTISSTISEHDLSFTSPSAGETPKLLAIRTQEKKQGSIDHGECTVSSALHRLAPKPFANMSGSCQNPIIVDETASPPQQTVQAVKRMHRQQRLSKPHQFIGNGYRDLYSYRATRPVLAAMPANGNTFTGHQSHDIYRMMNAKLTAAPDPSPKAERGRSTLNIPFEVQYPLFAQVFAQQQNASQHQPPYTQYNQVQAPLSTYRYPIAPAQNEHLLRRRAVQYIREYSRPSPQKRWPSDADLDETSDDGAEGHQQHTRTQPNTSTPQSGSMPPPTVRNVDRYINHKPVIHRHPDPNFLVGHLVEHTALITSLLQLYPHSTDRKGLRNDISMMIQLQNQHVTDWMKIESRDSCKRRKDNSGSTASLDYHPQPIMTPATRIQNEKDNTLRKVFSANADIWQDGTGRSVADVFAVVPVSSPVASSSDGRIAGSTHMPSASMTHTLPTQEKAGTTCSAITTPTKQILIFDPGAARCKGMSSLPSMEDIRAKFRGPSINPKDNCKSLANLSLPSHSSKDPVTPIKTTLDPVNTSITPSSNGMHNPSFSHSSHSNRSEHTTTQHLPPSSDDDDDDNDELHVPNKDDASSSFHSESSSKFRVRRRVLRLGRRGDAVDGQRGTDSLLKE